MNLLETHLIIDDRFFDIIPQKYCLLNESYGVYDGQIELVKSLVKYIRNNHNNFYTTKEILEKHNFKNIFYKKLSITCNKNKSDGYDSDIKFDDETKLIEEVIINIKEDSSDNYSYLYNTFIHELTHAWEDYNRIISGKCQLKTLINNDNYKEAFKISNDSLKDLIQQIDYYVNKFEINAYISELNSIYSQKNIVDYKDALDYFNNLDSIKRYDAVLRAINTSFEKIPQKFTDKYNEINSTDYTESKLKKYLQNKFDKLSNKISSMIPKIWYKYKTEKYEHESASTMTRGTNDIITLIMETLYFENTLFIDYI